MNDPMRDEFEASRHCHGEHPADRIVNWRVWQDAWQAATAAASRQSPVANIAVGTDIHEQGIHIMVVQQLPAGVSWVLYSQTHPLTGSFIGKTS